MEKIDSTLPGCFAVKLGRFQDERGSFVKPFVREKLAALGVDVPIEEAFFSVSHRGVLRGFHFQTPPHDHHKVVFCLAGRILDVIVDLRRGSPTYGRVATFELSAHEPLAVVIPKGMGHAFCSLEDGSLVGYLVSTGHAPQHDGGILWSSVDLKWPIAQPIVSGRDSAFTKLSEFDSPFRFTE